MAQPRGNGVSMSSDKVAACSIDIAATDNVSEKHNKPVRAPYQGTFLFAHRIPGTAFAAYSALQLERAIRPLQFLR